jgi:hypothetical protein
MLRLSSFASGVGMCVRYLGGRQRHARCLEMSRGGCVGTKHEGRGMCVKLGAESTRLQRLQPWASKGRATNESQTPGTYLKKGFDTPVACSTPTRAPPLLTC